jgi:hypothetical protein
MHTVTSGKKAAAGTGSSPDPRTVTDELKEAWAAVHDAKPPARRGTGLCAIC